MLLKKQGFPEEDEIVMCTVKDIHFHSVFAKLDEYDRIGLIHISEVSPGRIRNIRDFVVEGKKVVCKILRVDKEKGHIDLSLRRVTESQKRAKVNEVKQEQKAEKIVEITAKSLNLSLNDAYNKIAEKVMQKYHTLYPCFETVVKDEELLLKLGVPESLAKPLTEAIKLRIKEAEVQIGGELKLTSYAPDGIEIIKKAIKKVESASKDITAIYEGAGKYRLLVKAPDYKAAEKILDKATSSAISFIEKAKGAGSFSRAE